MSVGLGWGGGVDASTFGRLGGIGIVPLDLQYKHAAGVEKWVDVFALDVGGLKARGVRI